MITELAGERVQAVSHSYEVDGRVSWHAPAERGYAPMNCYVLRDGEDAILVETGLRIHRAAVLADVAEARGEGPLDVLILRQQEFDGICNLLPLVEAFPVRTIWGQHGDALVWADVLPDFGFDGDGVLRHDGNELSTAAIVSPKLEEEETIALGSRELQVFRPDLRLLQTHWVYDGETRTLFTSDSFTHALAGRPEDSPVLTAEHDATTPEHVARHLTEGRFWWVADAHTDGLRRWLASVFERFEVETIAPSYGQIISGADLVAHHYEMVDAAMEAHSAP